MKVIVFDFETTGFSSHSQVETGKGNKTYKDNIIEYAFAAYDNVNDEPIAVATELVLPVDLGGKKGITRINSKVTEITGLKQIDFINAVTQEEAQINMMEFLNMFGPEYAIAGHNIKSFDMRFLRAALGDTYVDKWMEGRELLDTMVEGRKMKKEGKIKDYKLGTIADFYGIDFKPHRALEDVFATAKVIARMFDVPSIIKEERAKHGF